MEGEGGGSGLVFYPRSLPFPIYIFRKFTWASLSLSRSLCAFSISLTLSYQSACRTLLVDSSAYRYCCPPFTSIINSLQILSLSLSIIYQYVQLFADSLSLSPPFISIFNCSQILSLSPPFINIFNSSQILSLSLSTIHQYIQLFTDSLSLSLPLSLSGLSVKQTSS